jgi:thiol:disulfide interchange protein DsbA
MNMKRREFSLGAAGAALASSTLLASLANAQAAKPVAGKDYHILDRRAPVEAPAGSVEVVEFFSYMCHVCNAFEPTFNAWTKSSPQGVVVRRVPVPFLPNFDSMQRLYFALDAMNLVNRLHAAAFAAVHVEHRKLSDAATIADWVAAQGVDRSKFMEQFNSFTTATKTTRAKQLTDIYAIDGVPMLGIAGRFLTAGTAKGLRVVEALVADIKAGR